METNLIKTDVFKNGRLKFCFNQMEVSKILSQKYGYAYIRFNGVGKYLKSAAGGYKIVPFQNLKNSFTDYLRNQFDVNELPNGLSYEEFMNCYFDTKPVSRNYTSEYFNMHYRLNENNFVLENQFLKFK